MAVTLENKATVRLRQQIATLESRLANLRTPRNENTPKRQREGMARRCEAENLEATRRAMITLAEAHERGEHMGPWTASLRNRCEIEPLVSRVWDTSGGYYTVKLSDKFRDESDRAVAFRLWLKGLQAGTYDADDAAAARAARIQELTEQVRFSKIPGFFPTPDALVRKVMEWAELDSSQPGMQILEPSAGMGSIADAIREAGHVPICFEINNELSDILEAKGHHNHRGNFLGHAPVAAFDRVLMNPPFENGQDAAHVWHAYRFLKPGGRLVAIVSPGFQMSRGQKFAEWLENVGAAVIENPEGSFKSSFCPTGVRTFTLIIDKP